MKAVIYSEYGSPEVLSLAEVEKPIPKKKEVLLKVMATSLNASDTEFLVGSPFYIRIWGPFKPVTNILGSDIAGIVEAVGSEVTKFKPGDAVFGDNLGHWGGLAEYARVKESSLTLKPDTISFEDAAAMPQAGIVGLQGIRNFGKVTPGQQVLINGAGGGSGSYAVQIAKLAGAEVTAVDSTEKMDFMKSMGADHLLDYTKEDFTANGLQYDLILDLIYAHPLSDYKRALRPGGKYMMVGGNMKSILKVLILGSLISLTGNKNMKLIGITSNKGTEELIGLIEEKKVVSVIDKRFPLERSAEAFQYLIDGRAKGKVVVTVSEDG